MKEAMGGTWIFGIVILFIALFAAFLTYSINYTKAFNTKNEIINLIERYEGYTTASGDKDLTNMSDDELENGESVEEQAFYKIKKTGYNYRTAMNIDCKTVDERAISSQPQTGGYCVVKYCPTDGRVYYKVTTFIAVELPVIGYTANIKVSGETKTLYYDGSGYECATAGI